MSIIGVLLVIYVKYMHSRNVNVTSTMFVWLLNVYTWISQRIWSKVSETLQEVCYYCFAIVCCHCVGCDCP